MDKRSHHYTSSHLNFWVLFNFSKILYFGYQWFTHNILNAWINKSFWCELNLNVTYLLIFILWYIYKDLNLRTDSHFWIEIYYSSRGRPCRVCYEASEEIDDFCVGRTDTALQTAHIPGSLQKLSSKEQKPASSFWWMGQTVRLSAWLFASFQMFSGHVWGLCLLASVLFTSCGIQITWNTRGRVLVLK